MGEATGQRKRDHQLTLTFKKELLILDDIVKKYVLPRVIHCDMGTFRESHLDLSKPILAFSKRSVQKVSATSMTWDCDRRELKVTGSDLLIPEDYAGWFAILSAKVDASCLKSATPYRTLSHLNQSKMTSFLIGGISPIPCYLVMSCHNSVRHIPHQVLPGDILRKAGNHVFHGGLSALAKFTTGEERHVGTLFSCGTPGDENEPQSFFMYHDEKDRSILLNSKQRGLFYVIAQDGAVSDEETVAVQIKDIIRRHKLPLIVKLLHGLVPAVSCGFTGTFLLTNADVEDTVVASTMFKTHLTSLEFPLNSDILFQVAEHTTELTTSEAWTNAVGHCQSRAPIYNKAIKVIADSDTSDGVENGSDPRHKAHEEHGGEMRDMTPEISKPGQPEQPHSEDTVQMRPRSQGSARRSRDSNVSDISKRVGVYAMDFSINPRDLSQRRKIMRTKAFQGGEFGQQQVDSGIFSETTSATSSTAERTSSATSSFGDRPLSTHSAAGLQPEDLRTGHSPLSNLTNTLVEETDSLTSNGSSEIPIVCTPGRPTSSNPSQADSEIKVARDKHLVVSEEGEMVSTGFNLSVSSESPLDDVSHNGNSYNQLQQDGSSMHVYNVFKHQDRFVSIGPVSYHDEANLNERSSSNATDTAFMPFYLFHGSLSSTDDYITPASDSDDGYQELDDVEYRVSEDRSTPHPDPGSAMPSSTHDQEESSQNPSQNRLPSNPLNRKVSIPPTLPKRPEASLSSVFSPQWNNGFRRCVAQNSSGCYNRDLLIEELRKEIAIDSAMELAFRGLTLAEFTTLLYEDEIMDVHLTALLPKLGRLDLRKVALCLRSMRGKITLLTL
ncbi:unnamed protein product [Lymnaea stagnalis]|uniref:CABIT domain-containing protein n=1 Tax=Lymnaea stagnalis TaxID=6523 RepID=A0AAV2I691_LYMST